jgi:sugar lactone lactonase YvrE
MKTAKIGKLIKTIPCQCTLGEGVLWHADQQAIYWLDIEEAIIYRYYVVDETLEEFSLPQRIGSFAFTPHKDQIITAFAQGIAHYNLVSKELQWISQPELTIPGNRFNDGKADRQGRFWAGTMVENEVIENDNTSVQQAHLYCIDHQHNCINKIDNITISNGLCWNKAGNKLFHADSPSHSIFQYHYCPETGDITNKRLFATTNESTFPDGSTVDAQDHLWNAQWGSGNVIRYDTFGQIDLCLSLPVSQPSCIAIGGPNLDWLIITTAKQGLSKRTLAKEPLAGNVFIYQLIDISGLIEPECTICS